MSVPWPTISSVLSRCSFSTSNKCFRTGSGCRQAVDLLLPCPLTKPKSDCSAVIRPFLLIPFLRYTTSVLLQYCLDGRLSTLLPFLWDSYDPARYRRSRLTLRGILGIPRSARQLSGL